MSLLRPTALIAGGALSVHELRYVLAPGGSIEPVAGHGYMPLASLAVALLLGCACAQLLTRVAHAHRGGSAEPGRAGLGLTWLLAASSLVAIFAAQELAEGFLTGGRAHGPEAVFASGGWIAVPLSTFVGALVALGLGVARAVLAAAATVSARRRGRPPRAALRRPPGELALRRRTSLLALHLAGRAPPASP